MAINNPNPSNHGFTDERTTRRRRVVSALGIVLLAVVAGGIGYLLGARADWRGAMHMASSAAEEAAITARIETAFVWSDEISAEAIDVATQGAVVRLRGSVPSEDVRRRAVEIAEETEGVERVEDQLVVENADRQETKMNEMKEGRSNES